MTLTEFLTARLDEDEAAAWAAGAGAWEAVSALSTCNGPGVTSDHGDIVDEWHMDADTEPHVARQNPARVLREVEAKRRIVGLHAAWHVCVSGTYVGDEDDSGGEPCPTLRALVSVYADHPDYDEAWRPEGA